MLNKIIKQFIAATAYALLIFSVCFSNLGFVSEAFMVESDESKDDDSDKQADATISSVDFKLRTNGTSAISASKFGMFLNYETSLLDLVMGSADDLKEKSFYEDKIVANVEPYLNIRESDNENSEVVGKLYPASYGTIVEQGEEWTKIASGSVTGYVKNEYVSSADEAEAIAEELGTEAIVVKKEQANIHSSEDASSEILTEASADMTYSIVMPEEEEAEAESADTAETEAAMLSQSQVDKVKELYPEWVPVIYQEELVGYVSADKVTVIMALKEAVSLEEEQAMQETGSKTVQSASVQTGTSVKSSKTVPATEGSGQAKNNVSTATTEKSVANSPKEDSNVLVATTSSDEYLLACLVYCEAGNQSYEGQLAVANVVLNRVNNPGFAGSISEVIYETNQFSPASNGSLARALNNGPSSSASQAAKDALAGNNNIGDYLFFNGYVDTSKVSSYTVIGDHTFYNN